MVKKKLSMITIFVCVFSAMIAFSSYVSAEENETSMDHEAGVYYTIKKGDTLWDLSNRFSDSPWLWPDLWEENPQIPNPHFIYPGEHIRLLHNKGVEVESTESTVQAVEHAGVVQAEKPEEEAPFFKYSSINRVGFVKKTPLTPHGIIFKVKGGHKKIGQADIVYINPAGDATLAPGSRYTVYRTLDPMVDKKTKTIIGIQHYLTGVVEIIQVEPGFSLAKVVRSYRTIEINDMIMPYKQRSPKITLAESVKGLEGTILLPEERQKLIGTHHIVFIDKGREDGVKPGQRYSVYYQEKQPIDPSTKKDAMLPPVVFGSLLVLDTEETTAAAVVTRSQKTIETGDKISSPLQ
ncbi:MAG: LysM peptidoglycan-binding domain-containing protein [Deltaproteobacteria bacterium]|nr:LysM peptidoglycan-binding domain-containing protein [Deltaproteobacteria bacterium]